MCIRDSRFLPFKENHYPKFMGAQNCIETGYRNIYFLIKKGYCGFEVDFLVLR